ncbi:hypothetical protein DSO57_1009514 [Entomophthora muscae]|uniref:Uncharacterized protein n=1 Tax=Entomophthora muscae TaxID=34485 RepID=A0ACC2USE7_9FUNG|nr:hypothetical protein DSO57_1009514 [Entomophthora muscae]
MPQTELTRTALLENNFNPADLLNLPSSLDTLQCLLLAQFYVNHSYTKKFAVKIFCFANRLLPLLGLHTNPLSSSQWLERTLALQAEDLGFYHLSIGHRNF